MLDEILKQRPMPAVAAAQAPTIAEAVEESAIRFAPPSITPVEQFCHDQSLTTAESEAVEIIVNHQSAHELDMAIHKLQRIKLLAYRVALLALCLVGLPCCLSTSSGIGPVGVNYDPVTNTWSVAGSYQPVIKPTK